MQWNDTAIVLSARKYGENSAVVRIFSRQQGVYGGVVRAAYSKSNRGIIQPGNIVSATWSARLEEQLGSLKMEMLEPCAALLMADPGRLAALTALCALIESALPERHPYVKLYHAFCLYIRRLKTDDKWQASYVQMELELLAEAGFGLDLRNCAATGVTQDLIYVSPKSGRAVCRSAGAPYHEKMLPLPAFLIAADKKNLAKSAEILDGMRLAGYFLEHWLLVPHHRKLPAARTRLIQIMKATHQIRTGNAAKTDS